MRTTYLLAFLLGAAVVTANAGTSIQSSWNERLDHGDEFARQTSDPLEPLNRGLFAFNEQLIRFVLRPVAKLTTILVPRPVLAHVGNAFENLGTPIRVAGSLLQADFGRAYKESGKLVINSTIGLGGFFRPSDKIPALANIPSEDIGQAFGKWGIPAGPYLFLPVLGPTSARDLVGRTADAFADPLYWWLAERDIWIPYRASQAAVENPQRLRTYDMAIQGALDRYIVIREGYLDYRAEEVSR